MLLHSSDAAAAALFVSRCYDDAAVPSSLHVPVPADVDSEPAPHLSVQSLPMCTAHSYTGPCLLLKRFGT